MRLRLVALCLAGFPFCDDKGVEHEVSPWAKVEREVDRLGYVAIGAVDAQHLAVVLLEEELYLNAVGGDDRVVVRPEFRFMNGMICDFMNL